jgi:hypothetical protein
MKALPIKDKEGEFPTEIPRNLKMEIFLDSDSNRYWKLNLKTEAVLIMFLLNRCWKPTLYLDALGTSASRG